MGTASADPVGEKRQRTGKLSLSEMLFIMVLFHLSPFKQFKVFYHCGVAQQHRACLSEIPHYDRFVSLMPRLFAPLMVLLHSLSGEETASTSQTQPSSLSVTIAASPSSPRCCTTLACRSSRTVSTSHCILLRQFCLQYNAWSPPSLANC